MVNLCFWPKHATIYLLDNWLCACVARILIGLTVLRFLLPIPLNAFGLLFAVWILPQYIPDSITFTGDFPSLLLAGAVIGIINGILKPILHILAFPLIFLTGGIFSFVLNIGLLWLADYLLSDLTINGLIPLVLTSFILSFIHFIF